MTLSSAFVYNSKSMAFLAHFLYNFEIFALRHVKAALLVASFYAFKANNPERIMAEAVRLRNFCVYEKHVLYSRVNCSSSSLQELVIDFQHQLQKSWVRKSNVRLNSIVQFLGWVRLRSIAELNRTQSTDWIRLSSIEIQYDCVRFPMPGLSSRADHAS